MRITRRDFLKYCSVAAGALGLSASTLMKLEKAMASTTGDGPDVIWIAGQSCSGCITSLLDTVFYTDIGTLLLGDINLQFQETINATCGAKINTTHLSNDATANILATYNTGGYVLLVEGSIPTGPNGTGDYCNVGDLLHGAANPTVAGHETMQDIVKDLAAQAGVVLSIGTCSSFGGIPAAKPNPTGARSASKALAGVASTYFATNGYTTDVPVVNIPGCPPHPDWIVGTILTYMDSVDANSPKQTLLNAVKNLRLNKDGAPGDFYGQYQCNAGPCTWRYNNSSNNSHYTGTDPNYTSLYPTGNSRNLGKNIWESTDVGCLGILGCKGRKTKADCSARKWNTDRAQSYGVNWCVGSRGGCHGCTYPTFPDGVGKFFTFR